MGGGLTIGVLSTWFGGGYFGSVLDGMSKVTAAHGGRIIGIQTLDAGTNAVDLAYPPAYRHHVAWQHISAFVVILNAVDRQYLAAIRAAGKPVVMISDTVAGFDCPAVLPDNEPGMATAVAHLIEHGHQRIAFAGSLTQKDLRERYEAYRKTLLAHGIEPDPRLFFDTGDNQIGGGERAAEAMLSAGLPSTAVVAGNDLNAIGLTRVLQRQGYELPKDQAIVGFDDFEAAVYQTPSLSSVRQPFETIGETAVELLLRALDGEDLGNSRHYIPTSFVARESCGCPSTLRLGYRTPASAAPEAGTAALGPETRAVAGTRVVPGARAVAGAKAVPGARAVPAVLPGGVPRPHPGPAGSIRDRRGLAESIAAALDLGRPGEDLGAGWVSGIADAITRCLDAAVHGLPEPEYTETQQALNELYVMCPLPEKLVAVMRCLQSFGEYLCDPERESTAVLPVLDLAGQRRVDACVQELMVTLASVHARRQYQDSVRYEATFPTRHDMSMDLLRSHEQDPRSLTWLAKHPQVRGGCLGLWTQDQPANPDQPGHSDQPDQQTAALLELYGQFPCDDHDAAAAKRVAVEQFPPSSLVDQLDGHPRDMLFVVPVKVSGVDRGMLAAVEPIDEPSPARRENINQRTAMFTMALDYREVMETLRQQKELLRHAALYDQLTGLPNRVYFLDRLNQAIDRANRNPDYHFGVLLLDFDGFKIVNDSLGHLAGDELLVQIAARIKADLRKIDVAARFGGDEFAILLDGIENLLDPSRVAERLHVVLAPPFDLGTDEVVIGASIGIALGTGDYRKAEDVIRDADIAMYSAKTSQKGTHAVFDAAMHAKAVERLRIEADLRQALDRSELEVYYQPIVRLPGVPCPGGPGFGGAGLGEPGFGGPDFGGPDFGGPGFGGSDFGGPDDCHIVGFEALLRWRHPQRGMLLPEDFLAVAEDSGVILPIGRWMMETACKQVRQWQLRYRDDSLRIGFNISNRQFWGGHLLADIDACAEASGLSPACLDIDVTEQVIMHDGRLASDVLRELHEYGVQLYVDDFGTGLSSLEALHRLEVDALKIDRSFVAALGAGHKGRELARAIVVMGINLGLDLIAEGIETTEQFEALSRLGCGYGQGFLFTGPVPAAQAERFLRTTGPSVPRQAGVDGGSGGDSGSGAADPNREPSRSG